MLIDNGNKYIHYELYSDTGKTQRWLVRNKANQHTLGTIQWYSGWRQYTFIPKADTEYNNGCLESIISFLNRLNEQKRILEATK